MSLHTPEAIAGRRDRLEKARTRAATALGGAPADWLRDVLAAADLKTASLIRLAQIAERGRRGGR